MWMALLKRYWQVTLFKETPANTPYSLFLLSIISTLFYLIIILQWALAAGDKEFTLTASLFISALALLLSYVIYTGFLLLIFHQSSRFVQSLSCILAGHTIVHVWAFPLLLITPGLVAMSVTPSLGIVIGTIYLIITLVLTIWQFMVTVHVYKHALDINYFSALLASLGLLACNILMVSLWRI